VAYIYLVNDVIIRSNKNEIYFQIAFEEVMGPALTNLFEH